MLGWSASRPIAGRWPVGTGLRNARTARGWSQERLVREIEQYARRHVTDVASTASLRVYVSEWENGKRNISDRYASILRQLLGITDSELRGDPSEVVLSTVDGYDELLSRIDSASNVSQSMVKAFNEQTELLRTMDRQLGASGLVDQMTGHLAALEDALNFAVLPSTRRPVALALAGASTLAAWQAIDAGAVERPGGTTNSRSGRLAMLKSRCTSRTRWQSRRTCCVRLAYQGLVLNWCVMRSEPSARAVLPVSGRGCTRLRPSCAFTPAMPDDCHRALDAAAASIPPGAEDRDPDMLSIFLNDAHLARWRGNALALLGDDGAVNSLYGALEVMDPSFVRAQAGLHADLVQAHLARAEYDDANKHLRKARLLASRTGSVRQRRRIDLLSARL